MAHAQARLLAAVSQLGQTEPEGEAGQRSQQISWLGPQGDWEAREPAEPPASARYRFGQVFARGGLGAVRQAEDRKLGRTIAVKELLRFDDRAVQRFVREAAIMARLQHPGIVPLYDLGRDAAGLPFLCMKLVDGTSLEQRIGQCADVTARLGLVRHVITAAEAIAYAHRQQIVHRDVKPANILIGELGEAVVIDWGLAKDLSQGSSEESAPPDDPGTASDMTAAGSLLGTLRYMPPEQARGEGVDARSDVYALGATLYHLLAGVPPFHDRRAAQLVHDVLASRPRPLVELAPTAPPALIAIVEKAMSQEPGARYATAEALTADLRRFDSGLAVGAHAYSLGELSRLWWRRHRAVGIVAAASLAALAGVGVVAFASVREARDVAEERQGVAEQAQGIAEQRAAEAEAARTIAASRADELLLSQALLALDVDPSAVFAMLAQLEPDPARDGAVRAIANAAYARAAVDTWMTGLQHSVDDAIRLSDGTWIAGTREELWRWGPGELAGTKIGTGGRLVVSTDRSVWAVIRNGEERGEMKFEVHRVGAAAPVSQAAQLLKSPSFYRWHFRDGGAALEGTSVLQSPSVVVDVASGEVTSVTGPDAPAALNGAVELESSPDGRRVAGWRDGTLVVWDRSTGAVTKTKLPGDPTFHARGWTADGRAYIFACADLAKRADPERVGADRVLVWQAGGPPRVVEAEWAVAARDVVVFIGTRGGRMAAWAEAPDGTRRWTRDVRSDRYDDFVMVPQTTRDGDVVTWSFGEAVDAVDVASGALLYAQRRRLNEAPVIDSGALLLPRAAGLARVDLGRVPWRITRPAPERAGASARWSDDRAWVVREEAGRVTRRSQASEEEALPAACGAWTEERTIAAVAADGRALITDRSGGTCFWGHGRTTMLDTPAHWLTGAAFASAGDRFVLGFAEGTVLEWRRPDEPPARLATPSFHSVLRYTPDSSALLALGDDGAIRAVGGDGQVRTVVEGRAPESGQVRFPAWTLAPTGATLALRHRGDAEVQIVDVASGQATRLSGATPSRTEPAALRFSPSGQSLALLDGDGVHLWSLARPDAPGRAASGIGYDLAFLDERTLVVLGSDGGLEIVDPASGTHAPLYVSPGGNGRPTLAQTPRGVALRTRAGEELEFVDVLPPAGDPLRTWLRERAGP